MRRSRLFFIVTIVVVAVVLALLLFMQSGNKTNDVASSLRFKGYNMPFQLKDGNFVVYNGHGFLRYSPSNDEFTQIAILPAEITKISVAPDGKLIVFYVSQVSIQDPLIKTLQQGWATLDTQSGKISSLPRGSLGAYAIDDGGVALLGSVSGFLLSGQESTDNTQRLWLYRNNQLEQYAEYQETPEQVRFTDGIFYALENNVQSSSLYKIDAEKSSLIKKLDRRASLSTDGQYAYSVSAKNKDRALVETSADLQIFKLPNIDESFTIPINTRQFVSWGTDDRICIASSDNNEIKVLDLTSKKWEYYQLKADSPRSLVVPGKDSMLTSTNTGIYIYSSDVKSDVDFIEIDPQFTLGESSREVIGNSVFVEAYNHDVMSLINGLNSKLGDNYLRYGFRVIYSSDASFDDD